jgi:pimeloyl-ACP methyl ester carboxylesterase
MEERRPGNLRFAVQRDHGGILTRSSGRPRGAAIAACAAVLIPLLALVLSGCSSQPTTSQTTTSQPRTAKPAATDGPDALKRFYTQKLTWSSCDTIFQCASVQVPLDYTNPAGKTIQLAVIRKQATDPAHRIGSLITNPGGPGGSGVEFIKQNYPSQPGQPSYFGQPLRARFDIVGFDPRGVGQSAPVTCLTDTQLDHFFALDPAPTTPGEVDAVVSGDKSFDAGCQARSGALLPYVGTVNAARDMDILRAALGDPKMYYLGASYGTYLGAVYAQLFPTHLARTMLDGPVPPNLTSRQTDLGQASGFQDELNRFIADCVTYSDCPLGTNAAAAEGKLAGFFASTLNHPLPTGTSRTLDEALAENGVLVTMYDSPTSWPLLRAVLAQAMAGDGQGLLVLSDLYYERDSKTGHYSNETAANVAINCIDNPPSVHSVDGVRADLGEFEQASPLLGATFAWGELQCVYWPVPPEGQPHPIHYAGSPPILVVGTIHDPATPYRSARDMANQLGSAVLLTYNGDGHTAYGRGSTCINNAVNAYLTQGTVPATGTVCQPDASAVTPAPKR